VAEPKFDGQRAQLHVAGSRTSAAFSRLGRSLLTSPGLGWLQEARWPVRSIVLDGELCASTGTEGVLGVLEARQSGQAPLAFLAFDVLQVGGREVMSEPWTDRRKRLDDLGAALTMPNVAIVPAADDAARLWATWVAWGGEGIVLKDRRAPYRPGLRSPDWLKVKHRTTLAVRVEGGDPELVRWGDGSWAARLTLTYQHPLTRRRLRIDEIVRVPQPDRFTLRAGERGELLCWGFLPSGRLRHPVWMRWASEARGYACEAETTSPRRPANRSLLRRL
jgi:ATP-dependent DNA ligase